MGRFNNPHLTGMTWLCGGNRITTSRNKNKMKVQILIVLPFSPIMPNPMLQEVFSTVSVLPEFRCLLCHNKYKSFCPYKPPIFQYLILHSLYRKLDSLSCLVDVL